MLLAVIVRVQASQTIVTVSGNPDVDLGAAAHGLELSAWIVESKDLLPGQAFASCSVRAVLRHSPAVAPTGAADREACGLDGHGRVGAGGDGSQHSRAAEPCQLSQRREDA